MKPCAICGELKPEAEYNRDRTRPDGLTKECRECNKERARRWYAENRARKIAATQEYKRAHAGRPAAEKPAKRERQETGSARSRSARPRASRPKQQPAAEEPRDYQLIRFTAGEWLHCLLRGQERGLTGAEYVRALVQRDRSAHGDA